MTAFLPNTRVSVRRETGASDAWGDDTGATAALASGVVASVTELSQRSYLGTEQRSGVVEMFTIRLRPGTDVREGDQLEDERSGAVYQVETVTTPPALAGLADVRTTCRRTAARS